MVQEPGLLDELERRVEEAERKFQAADLDLRLKELEAARQRQVCKGNQQFIFKKVISQMFHPIVKIQATWLSRYSSDLIELRLELERLEDISKSLPLECWNTIRLEP